MHPPGYKRATPGPINQVPALPKRRAQLGAQLRYPLIGQDLPHLVNSDIRVTVPPCNPDSNQDIQHPLRQLDGDSCRLGGLVDAPRRAKRGKQTRLSARRHHGQAPGRLGKRVKLYADITGIQVSLPNTRWDEETLGLPRPDWRHQGPSTARS